MFHMETPAQRTRTFYLCLIIFVLTIVLLVISVCLHQLTPPDEAKRGVGYAVSIAIPVGLLAALCVVYRTGPAVSPVPKVREMSTPSV